MSVDPRLSEGFCLAKVRSLKFALRFNQSSFYFHEAQERMRVAAYKLNFKTSLKNVVDANSISNLNRINDLQE